MQIFIGLGSNLGDREGSLVAAKDELMKRGVLTVLQSEVLETAPLDGGDGRGGTDQPHYLNQVLECETELLPKELLQVCEEVEAELGRDMSAKGKWKPRVIDVDILFYGSEVVTLPGLTIPHPGVLKRDFVLAGMKELAPDFPHPVAKKPMCVLGSDLDI